MLQSLFPLLIVLIIATGFGAAHASAGYRVTDGRITHDGAEINLRGINWFGFETASLSPHGLWRRSWQELLDEIENAGFNAVRLPVCPATLRGRTPSAIDYDRNPDLLGLDSLQLLDRLMTALNARQIHVLLDHHRPDCRRIPALWYTDDYPESQWIADLVFMARRYRHLDHFMGLDLKNEPHGEATWGAGDPATDWNRAAERAGRAVLAEAPDLLIFVEGIERSGDCRPDVPQAWWGGNLSALACHPLELPPDRVVLSPHVYGPDVYAQKSFEADDFPANMHAIWQAHFGRFADEGHAVVIGEFGGRYGHHGDSRDIDLQNALVNYLRSIPIAGSFYWALNPNSADLHGLLRDDWTRRWPTKLALLEHLWHGTGLPSSERSDSDQKIWSPRDGTPPHLYSRHVNIELAYESTPLSANPERYCADVRVHNVTDRPLTWDFRMPVIGRPTEVWNADHEPVEGGLRVRGRSHNRQIAPRESVHFGYCADRPATAKAP